MKKILAGAAAVSVLTVGAVAAKNFINPIERVDKVVDGDTFILAQNRQAVRLFGIDSPEIDQCYGIKSYDRLSKLLSKKQVQLKEPLADHFGRIVALVYVDGKLINEIMIREGYAAYRSEPGSGKEAMKAAHEYAKSRKLGIYSPECSDETPPDPKCVIKGNNDLDRNELLYFPPDCRYYTYIPIIKRYEGDRWFCTAREAVAAGFKLSPSCK